MSTIGVLGAGTWGMALSRMLANSGHKVEVWSALPTEIDELQLTNKKICRIWKYLFQSNLQRA